MTSQPNGTPDAPQITFTGIGAVYVNTIDGVTIDAFGRATLQTKNLSFVLSRPVVDHLLQSMIEFSQQTSSDEGNTQ